MKPSETIALAQRLAEAVDRDLRGYVVDSGWVRRTASCDLTCLSAGETPWARKFFNPGVGRPT
jgi:hypothetical protein